MKRASVLFDSMVDLGSRDGLAGKDTAGRIGRSYYALQEAICI